MSVWKSGVEEAAFRETHCRVCFQPDEALKRVTDDGPGCPHLLKAQVNKVALPEPWTRKRNAPLGSTFKCDDFRKQPAVNRRRIAPDETPSMFDDVDPDERLLVPVEGWPDYAAQARRQSGGDHQ